MSSRKGDRFKRAFDLIVGGAFLVFSLPVQAGVAVAIKRSMGSPVLFRQPRPGKDGIVFELVKFRTMRLPEAEHVTDGDRITRLGQCLRSTSLDEVPTLWNAVKGDMSLVGRRPLLVDSLPLYTLEQARRHEVRPGVTKLAQISGRNSLAWEQKFELDALHANQRSLSFDLNILAATAIAVVNRRHISQPGHATAEPFGPTIDMLVPANDLVQKMAARESKFAESK